MKKFFSRFGQRIAYDRAYQQALSYAKNGDSLRSFEMFNKLFTEHPYDVNVRRQLLLLADQLGKDIDLPDEHVTNLKQ